MLRSLFTPCYSTSDLFPDGMDRHTHILWGVDDGASCLKESLGIIRQLKAMGLRGAYCTPHIKTSYPENTPDRLCRRFDRLVKDTREEGFLLKLAAEYMLDEQFEMRLSKNAPLTYDGKHMLIELPQHYLPNGWKDMISAVRDRGYTPVLAHPERYGHILQEDELFQLAEQERIKYQGNAGSLGGLYGKQAFSLAKKLRDRHLYAWWGTDSHTPAMASNMPIKK